jgi:hypothetical protein
MTPLITAVDSQDREMFKFLFDVASHLQQTQGSTNALTSQIDLQDIK